SICFLVLTFLAELETGQGQSTNGVYIVYMGASAAANGNSRDDHAQLLGSLLRRKGDDVVQSYKHGFSGFAARLSEKEAQTIAEKPGVVSVFPDPLLQLHTTRSWDFLKYQTDLEILNVSSGSDSSSKSPGSETTIIGILDTAWSLGIWPESESFNDKNFGPIPSRWKGTCMAGRSFNSTNCNRKLIGARWYEDPDNDISDFNTARDLVGHGTHVAATAAGSLVPDASYYGLASGTAKGGSPESRIAVYRVCTPIGCRGSAILAAFDNAIADGVDVLSLSLGAAAEYEPKFSSDPISIGAFHAVEKGITVVCSAGNGGPGPQTVVNAAPWILTVAATTIDRDFQSDVVLGGNKAIKGGGINFANLQSSPVYPLIYGSSAVEKASEKEARNCDPGSLDGTKVKGKILLCENKDGEYSYKEKLEEVVRLGGIGLILIDDDFRAVASNYRSFPMTAVTSKDGAEILSYIKSTRNAVATILPTPDVAAPGVGILASWPGNDLSVALPNKDPPAFNILSGTSMACPHVSGLAALVKSQNPTWSPSAIRSAIMTTATQTNNLKSQITSAESIATPYDYGAGEVSITQSSRPGLVYETDTIDYLQFLCNYGYSVSKIKLLSSTIPDGFTCPENASSDLITNMNYPSMSISELSSKESKKVSRTVTNVGEDEELYTAVVNAPKGLEVKVIPDKLQFTKNLKKLSYEVFFKLSTSSNGEDVFGSIMWTNGKYRVHSPFVVNKSADFVIKEDSKMGGGLGALMYEMAFYFVLLLYFPSFNPGRNQVGIPTRKSNRVVRVYKHGFSGFAARLSEKEAQAIAQKPGVVSVFPDKVLKLHTTRSWHFLEDQTDGQVFKFSSGSDSDAKSAGSDTIIGFLDTVIICWGFSLPYRKLIGARYYTDPSNKMTTARDTVGHGTHVASTAVGSLVPGASYYGLASGTATGGSPASRIAVYKVCGPLGCLDSGIMAAFDDAIADGVDVLSLSLGAIFMEPEFSNDSIAIGAFHAVEKGITVVCSAGNSGPDPETVKNVAPWILTVAATTIDRDYETDIVLGGNKLIKGGGINFVDIGSSPIHPLVYGSSAGKGGENEARYCEPGSLDRDKVQGKILLCENEGRRSFPYDKFQEAKRVGAVGLILIDDVARNEPDIYYRTYPLTAVTSKDGLEILSYIINSTRYSDWNLLQPDVAAPGVNILAAWPGNDSSSGLPGKEPPGFNIISGTSMSCPHVSGIAAAIKSRYPTWSPSAIRSAIMTTATQINNLKTPIATEYWSIGTPYDYGTGEVSPTRSLDPGLIYETGTIDYLQFLCNYGYNLSTIKLLASRLPDGFSCPEKASSDLISNMNYPSIAISNLSSKETKKVSRTVTNVGDDELYIAIIDAPEGLEVSVTPDQLQFTKNSKRLSYEVSFRLSTLPEEDMFGSITWTSGKYRVHSPFVVSTKH
ncbi:hypothetical protein RJ640_020818, partial [Escallonia rubra]